MTGTSLLDFGDVSCLRGGRLLFRALSFQVNAGDAMVVTGPNGVGKSSLIRLAAGLLEPAAGKVSRVSTISLLGHDMALEEAVSLKRALGFWGAIDGVGAGRLADALDALGLAPLAEVPVRFLSSGQRRRAALARVIASGAKLWLLDEPGVGLDTESIALLTAAIERHRAAGGGVVLATHMDLRLSRPVELKLEPLS